MSRISDLGGTTVVCESCLAGLQVHDGGLTDRLKHLIEIKRAIYKKFQSGENYLKETHTTLTRLVRKDTR